MPDGAGDQLGFVGRRWRDAASAGSCHLPHDTFCQQGDPIRRRFIRRIGRGTAWFSSLPDQQSLRPKAPSVIGPAMVVPSSPEFKAATADLIKTGLWMSLPGGKRQILCRQKSPLPAQAEAGIPPGWTTAGWHFTRHPVSGSRDVGCESDCQGNRTSATRALPDVRTSDVAICESCRIWVSAAPKRWTASRSGHGQCFGGHV